jgi:uncharacterized membrane protein YhaH (DUF805 family)
LDFGTSIRTCFSKYATFTGRAARSEFWFFELFLLGVNVVLLLIDSSVLSLIVGLGTLLPALAVGARRLHDTDKTGWWQLLFVFPFVGLVILIIFWAQIGSAGTNRYGDDPLAPPAVP